MIPIVGHIIALLTAIIFLIVYILDTVFSSKKTAMSEYAGGRSDLTAMDKYQKDTLKKYKHLKPPKKLPTFEEFCYPKSFKIQPQQELVSSYMAPGQGHKELLVFHKIGAGKSCLAIRSGLKWKSKGRPLVVMPASLIPGFRNELRGPCGASSYLTEAEQKSLRELSPNSPQYKKIIQKSDDKIDESWQIYSYNKFAEVYKKLKAPIIIVDEIQNIAGQGIFYQAIKEWITSNDAGVLLMSGTPIFDNPKELYAIAFLLRILDTSDPAANYITPENIPKLFAGKVSYYAGAPEFTFPETTVKVKKCRMSKFQTRWYQSEVAAEMSKTGDIKLYEISNDFYIKSRQRSNIVYPNGLVGSAGINALTKNIILNSLDVYSAKYFSLIKKLKQNQLSFVYTSFTGFGGITALVKCLRAHGWRDFATDGPGKRRFAIWSGEQSGREKDVIRATFNSPENDNAGQIQVILGSPSIREGVTLTRLRQVHVLEAYWNMSRLEQIYGRAVRYCSHKSLPKEDRNVMIYIYCAIASNFKSEKKITPMKSVDLYMLHLAEEKRDNSAPYIDALINTAIDKYIHYE